MRKKLFGATLLGIFFSSSLSLAQSTGGVKARHQLKAPDDDSPTETTLEIDEGAFLGYGGYRWGTQLVDGQWVPAFGIRGSWLYKETVAIGVDLGGLIGEPRPFDDDEKEGISQSLGTWGVVLERILSPRQELHYHYGLTFGRGISAYDASGSDELPSDLRGDRIFYYLAPEVSAVLNLTKYTKPFVGIRALVPFAGRGNEEIKESKLLGVHIFLGLNVGNFTL